MDSLLSALSNNSIEDEYPSTLGGNGYGGRKEKTGTIFDTLRADERFSMLVEVLEKNRGLRDDLDNSKQNISMFAPTNEAFKKLHEYLGLERGVRGEKVVMPKMDEVTIF